MGKIYLNEEAYGGDVIANPEGTATDTLETIQIGETVYSLPSGGGGGGSNFSEKVVITSSFVEKMKENVSYELV